MKRAALLAAGLLALTALPAAAADIPMKAPIVAPAMAPAATWTGFYIGANGGGTFGKTGASHTGIPLGSPLASGDYNLDHNTTGWFGGGQIGYNFQAAQWLFGVEADFQGADIKGTGTLSGLAVAQRNGVSAFPGNFVTASDKLDYFGTLRGRFGGLVSNDLLLYATGGLIYGRVNDNGQFHYQTPVDYVAAASGMKTGWTAGAGFEYRIVQNWSVKAEYLYYDLGSQTITSNFGVPATPPFQSQFDFKTRGSLVRGGINYLFDWGGPVVAKY
jgi:outer membrane immunogenic protein